MKDRILIGFIGKARSGKDTAGEYLVTKHNFTRISFADKLKTIAMEYFGLTKDECYENKNEWSRRILQSLGVCFRDVVDDLFWIKYAMKNLPNRACITDVRFLNEAEHIKNKGGILIKIVRDKRDEIEYGGDHQSETEMEEIKSDIIIYNNNDILESFYHKIDVIMDKYVENWPNE